MDRVEALRADIERGPAAVAELLGVYLGASSPLDAVASGAVRGRRVAFVGLGSSLFASLDAASALRAGGIAAWAEFASADGAPPSEDLVVVAVSASGRTPETDEVARRHRGTSLVIGVTNVPGSPLAEASDVVLPLFAGVEAAGISTLTYRATVVVQALLAARFGLAVDVERVRAIELPAADGDSITEWADLLDGAPSIDVIGPASRLGAVSQAALMLREAPRLPAHAWETADWLHTAVYLALPGHRAVLLPGSPADAEVIDTIRRRGGEVIVLDEDPMLASATVDRLACELWSRTG
jgi:glucosamine--fructose-6-phosphate aminotransferase (isomerizing)